MDRKAIAILIVSFGLLLGLQPLAKWMFPTQPGAATASTNGVARATAAVGGSASTAASAVPSLNGVQALPGVPPGQGAAVPESTLWLTNGSSRWLVTSRGGGIRHIELVRHSEFTGRPAKGRSNSPVVLNHDTQDPIFALRNAAAIEGDGSYALRAIPGGVRAEKVVGNGLAFVREYRLTTNEYILQTTIRVENRTDKVLALPELEWATGVAVPMNSHDKGDMLSVDWFNGSKASQTVGWVSTPGLFCMMSAPRQEFRHTEGGVVWGAAQNQFFSLIALPDRPAKEFAAQRVLLPAPTAESLRADPEQTVAPAGVATSMRFGAAPLEAGKAFEQRFSLYAGPKEYFALSRIQPQFDQTLGYGIFGFFAKPLLLGMNFLHGTISVPYGWCIVLITLGIKIVFWPFTAISTRSMKRMAELGPQLQSIRDKYKDDPKRLNEKTMQFMRESGYNPVAGCLPIFIQLPVFFGFFTMLRSAIELRGASFLWCSDLAAADTLFVIPGLGFIPLLGVPGHGLPFNLMPLFYVATALWQTHLTPTSPQMDASQQKLMRWMPLMFLALFYNYSAGLTLYWTVQNLLSILQTKLTRAKTDAAPVPASRAVRGHKS